MIAGATLIAMRVLEVNSTDGEYGSTDNVGTAPGACEEPSFIILPLLVGTGTEVGSEREREVGGVTGDAGISDTLYEYHTPFAFKPGSVLQVTRITFP